MSWLTTHILDTSRGAPAAGVVVICEIQRDGNFEEVARGSTDADGRLKSLFPTGESVGQGVYRLTFETANYFAARNESSFYPCVQIVFEALASEQHYHVPLLISPFGYSTYRGN